MTKDNSQTIEWDSDEKTWWSRRSKLEKKLLVFLIIAIVLISGFLLYLAIKPTGFLATSESCLSPDCLLAASQIITHIDPDVDPCEDFFKFACGKFIAQTHGDIKATSIREIKEQVERQLAEIIKEPIDEDDHYIVRNQKELFQACLNETAIQQESLSIFEDSLEKLNGWPVVIGYQWKERLFDWTKMIYKLREMGYPHHILLNVNVMPDPGDSTKYIVDISNSYIKNIKDEHKELYKKYMTDVAVILGAERSRAAVQMEKVLDFMEKLEKLGELNKGENGDLATNCTADRLSRRFQIKEFKNYTDDIDWLEFINKIILPVENITEDDYVIFPRNEFLTEFFHLLYQVRGRTIANYIIWSIVDSIAPLFSKELKQLERNYTCLTQETSPLSNDRYEQCETIITSSYFPLPASILYARRYLPAEKREKVQELVTSIKTEFLSLVMKTSWMDDESKEKATEKANAMIEVIGAPEDYFDDAVFEKFEVAEDDETESNSFLKMMLYRAKLMNDLMYSQIHISTNRSNVDFFYFLISQVNAMYSPQDNALVLPVGILQGIFYNEKRPMYLNYGAIGSIIGHEIAHGFCKDSSQYDKDGNEGNMWTEETENGYNEATQCIIEDAEEFDVEDTESTINGTLTLEENIADFAGVKASYAAYKNWVKQNGVEPALPGIDYTPNQLFWISVIAHECYKLSGDNLEENLESNPHAHNAFRATAPMRNNEDFAKDFNCPAESNMNPVEKCQVF